MYVLHVCISIANSVCLMCVCIQVCQLCHGIQHKCNNKNHYEKSILFSYSIYTTCKHITIYTF